MALMRRAPDFVIGGYAHPYLLRWWLIPRNRWFNVYLHKMLRDDEDRALHDHPWPNLSIVLKGGYIEVMPDFSATKTPHTRIADLPVIRKRRRRWSIVFRRATACHRLELPIEQGGITYSWSLFITGPVVRSWYFHCKQGAVPWRDFVAADDPGAIGKGCGE